MRPRRCRPPVEHCFGVRPRKAAKWRADLNSVALATVATIAEAVILPTAETRILAVRSSEIDLECGSTTANFQRKKEVAFSPIFFIAGTKILVPRSSTIASYRDLRDKTVVVTAGTTNEEAVRAISEKQDLAIKFLVGKDHAESFVLLKEGKADAFSSDDVLLYGLVATTGSADQYHVVGEYLSYDPYGLMYRKDDPDFASVVDRTFSRLAQSRELVQLYNKCFSNDCRPASA